MGALYLQVVTYVATQYASKEILGGLSFIRAAG